MDTSTPFEPRVSPACQAWLIEQGFFEVAKDTWRLDAPGAMLFVNLWSQVPRVSGHITLTEQPLDAACFSPTWAALYAPHEAADSVDSAVRAVAIEGVARLAEHLLSGTVVFDVYGSPREQDHMLS